MTTKHTPGPWTVQMSGVYADLCVCRRHPQENDSEQWAANAQLIAAAPDLLKSLIDVMGWFDSSAIRGMMSKQGYQAEAHRIINEARKAIAKAEGGAA